MKKVNDSLFISSNLVARNRVFMPPMDTTMAKDGMANDFHIQHYGARAYGGVGTIIVETTGVSPEGRIRDGDLGLWKDEQIAPLAKVVAIAKQGGALIGVQLNHAGARSEVTENEVFGPTKRYAYFDEHRKFRLMNQNDLNQVIHNFVAAAKRAKQAGFDFVELHGAHEYLIHELIHPEINEVFDWKTLPERMAFLVKIVEEIHQEVKIPIAIRLSITDFDARGVDENYYKPLIEKLSPYLIYFNISSGEGIFKVNIGDIIKKYKTKIYRVSAAKNVKSWTNKIVFTGGSVQNRKDVDEILSAGIDGVFIGRELLANPNIVINTILEPEEIDEKKYHWNNNFWYDHKKYLTFKKKIRGE